MQARKEYLSILILENRAIQGRDLPYVSFAYSLAVPGDGRNDRPSKSNGNQWSLNLRREQIEIVEMCLRSDNISSPAVNRSSIVSLRRMRVERRMMND
jgi:hypothetical protein